MQDPLAEAERFLEIDWTREPQSERERKIRVVFLRRQVAKISDNPFEASLNLREQIRYRSSQVDSFAEDFRTAWNMVRQACDALNRTKQLTEMMEIIREADRGEG